jgi:hypothetical protein
VTTTEKFDYRLADFSSAEAQQQALESWATGAEKGRGIFITLAEYQTAQINNAAYSVLDGNWLGRGETSVVNSVVNFVFTGPMWFFTAHPIYAILFSLLFLLLWSVFGGAIARIAAIHVARDEKISVRQALRFSTSKVLSFAFAPLIPLIILLGLAALLGLGGLLLYVPYVGPIAVGALFILVLLTAFVMTLVLFGTVGGFNLMYPTVAVEGSDSFDAISRSFSYVFARPWRTLFYSAIALAYGALTYLFARLFIVVMLMLAHGSVGWFLGRTHQPNGYWDGVPAVARSGEAVNEARNTMWPTPRYDSLTYDIPFAGLKWSEDIAASLIAFWVYLTISLLGAYLISFYFSANTIIYYLLRREVDATDLDDVYVEQADEDFTDAPLDGGTGNPATAETPSAASPAGEGAKLSNVRIYSSPDTPSQPNAGAADAGGTPPPQNPPGNASTT